MKPDGVAVYPPGSSRARLPAPVTSRRSHGQRDRHNDAGSVRASIEGSGSPLILASKPRSR